MRDILLPCSAALAACGVPVQGEPVRGFGHAPGIAAAGSDARGTQHRRPSVSGASTDTPAEAEGRRTLSTAFARVGPDGHLTLELRDGRMLVLRDVTMGAKEYCGTRIAASGGGHADAIEARSGVRHCGGYAEVAAARPGGAALPVVPEPVLPEAIGPAAPR